MNLNRIVQKIGWKAGYDVHRFHRRKILDSFEIDTVLDVGANDGSFGQQLRCVGYHHRILSFEPLAKAFKYLSLNSKGDKKWEIFNFALGDTECITSINVAGNLTSSSLLNMLPTHINSAPESSYIGKEEITIKTIDSLFNSLNVSNSKIYLKIDTQGYEIHVLKGAENSMSNISIIQLEMSLISLYENEVLFFDMCSYLKTKRFELIGLEPGFYDRKTGQLLQVDGIFKRI